MWVCTNPTTSATHTITVSYLGAETGCITAACYDGLDSGAGYYENYTDSANSTQSVTTNNNDDWIITGCGGGAATTSLTPFGGNQTVVEALNSSFTFATALTEEARPTAGSDTQLFTTGSSQGIRSVVLLVDDGTTDITPDDCTHGHTVDEVTLTLPPGTDTIHIGRWNGAVVNTIPGTTWAAPASIISTQVRNDSSKYSWTAATSTLTLPSTDLADGYYVVCRIEFNGQNNRFNPVGRFIQSSGTGNFISGNGGGYSRDTSNNNAYIHVFAFIDNPSAGAQLQFQWKRDSDANATGTNISVVDVISLFYDDAAIFKSTATALPGGTTPTKITGFSESLAASNISLASDTVTIAHTTGKRYLVLGNGFARASTTVRTQRWVGFTINSVQSNEFKGYHYLRNANNEYMGINFGGIIRTTASDVDVEMYCYRGDGILSGDGGADVDGGTTVGGGEAEWGMVFIELKDVTEVIRSSNSGATDSIPASVGREEISIAANVNFNDADSFTKVDNGNVQAEQDMDALILVNASGASTNVGSGTRGECKMNLDVDGVDDANFFHGNYIRGNQGSQDTFGWSAHLGGYRNLSSGEDISVDVLRSGSGHQFSLNAGWVSFHAINLQSMLAEGTPEINPDDATHEHTAESNALTPAIEPNESTHAHTADETTLSLGVEVDPVDATHAHTADQSSLIPGFTVSPNDSTHGHTADQATLTPHYVMAPDDATHAHTAEEPVLTPGFTVAPNDATHGHTAETPNLLWAHTLAINDATHAHTAETPDLSLSVTISPNDGAHGHTSETPTLVQHSIIHFDTGPNYIDNGDLEAGDTDWVEGASLVSGFDDVNWSLVNGKIRSLDNTSSDVIYNTQDTEGTADATKSWRIRFLISDETANFGVRANLYNPTYSGILSTSEYYNTNGWKERHIAPNQVGTNFRLGFYRFSGHTGELDIDLISLRESDDRAVHAQTAGEPTLDVGSVSIDPDDATHGHTAEEPGLVPGYTVAPNDCTHDHTADNTSVQSDHTITSDETLHGHTAETPSLVQDSTLNPADTLHGHTADSPNLVQDSTISPNDTVHGHTADEPTLVQDSTLDPDDTLHAHTADEPGLSVSYTIAPDDTLHAHSADEVVIVPQFDVNPADTLHGHTADEAVIVPSNNLQSHDAFHGHTADEAVLVVPLGFDEIIFLNSPIFIETSGKSTVTYEIILESPVDQDQNKQNAITDEIKLRSYPTHEISLNSIVR